MTKEELTAIAVKAGKSAYAPYSNFPVGAALFTKSGKVYTGCNIENGAYGDTMCAERVALFKAVSEGEREFEAIAIAGGMGRPAYPCGSCRQVLSEFCDGNFKVYCCNLNGGPIEEYAFSSVMPLVFTLIRNS